MKRIAVEKINLTGVFIGMFLVFAGLIVKSNHSAKTTFSLLVLAACCYFLLAVVHHLKDKNLRLEIIVEYFLIALLALIIFQGLLI